MLKKHRKALFVMAILLVVGVSLRIYAVNAHPVVVPVENYEAGEAVYLTQPYSDASEEASDGYTVTVRQSRIVDESELCEQYHIDASQLDDVQIDYYYLVDLTVANDNNTSTEADGSGISLLDLYLSGTTYYVIPSIELFTTINPDMPSYSFALRTHTEMDVTVPFAMSNDVQVSKDELSKDPPKFYVARYPVKRIVKL